MEDSKFSIRHATIDDLPKVLEIERAVQVAPWLEENFQSEIQKPYSHFLIITDDETDSEVIGYIVFWVMFDECHILNLAVALPYRGLGFAKKLIRKTASITTHKGIRKILLEVRKSNHAAIQLYQSLNFVITHVRKGFYSDGEDAYPMALYLDEKVFF